MTDFLFSLPLTQSLSHTLSSLFLSLHFIFLSLLLFILLTFSVFGSLFLSVTFYYSLFLQCTPPLLIHTHAHQCVHTQTHTDVYTQLHTREPNSENAFPGILVQGILIGLFHVSALWKKKKNTNMLFANRVEPGVCVCY